MVRKILVLGMVAALAACGGKEQEAASVEAPAAGSVAATAEAAGGYRPLPGGVELGLDSHMRSDRIYETAKGATRRKVSYEVLSGSLEESVETVEQSLADAGYKAKPRKEGKNGAFSISFKKKKAKTLKVDFNPNVGKKPANPDALHLVAVSWQLKAAPKQ